MKGKYILCAVALAMGMMPMNAKTKTVKIRLLETSDVHGKFFPMEATGQHEEQGTMARISSYIDSLRQIYGKNLIVMDNGDILQGTPVNYYSNYIKTSDKNIAAEIINYLKYDVQGIGNHDVETGHKVYDKWISELKCPVVGANIIDTKTGKPYVKPYVMFNREGVKIAVLGMLTPAIPNWLKQSLWSGLEFQEMISSTQQWVKYLKEHENPDVIIGLFHSGKEGGIKTESYVENTSLETARQVDGLDIVFYGHDHTRFDGEITSATGKKVLMLDPTNNARYIADAEITFTVNDGKVVDKQIKGSTVNICDMPVDKDYVAHFQPFIDSVATYTSKKIGTFLKPMYMRDCFFGNSAFADFIHSLQLQITGADISFNAPLSLNTVIKEGDVKVSDMFNLYRFENQLYTMRMTGEEIRKHLEMSYDLWCNTMKTKNDHILDIDLQTRNDNQRYGFRNLTFNFDSASGIDYEVDVTKPDGQKVRILQMSDGRPFDEKAWYKVAMNSYRGNGGGELLTKGAGIPKDSLTSRILWESERDLRYYLMKEIEKAGTISPEPGHNWKFVPTEWAQPALERDKALLFPKK